MDLNIEFKKDKNLLTLFVNGRIDSNNFQKFYDDSMKIIEENLSDKDILIFDFENVLYISSAGLRDILRFKKMHSNMKLINVSNSVYEVFEMTGFTTMIEIIKGMRTISIEGLPVIGEGYIGKVYRLDEDKIIKVFMRIESIEDVYRERNLAKKAFILGLPTAMSYELVKVKEGGYGSIFEMVKSDCLNVLLANHLDEYEKYRDIYINLLDQIMSIEVNSGDLPVKNDESNKWIDYLIEHKAFSEKVLDKLKKMVYSIPKSNHLVHGDLHVKNIMIQNGEPILIDMETLGIGHPIFEISAFFCTYIAYSSTEENNCLNFLGIPDDVCKRLYKDTFDHIFVNHTDLEKEEIQNKISLFSYMWLTYKTYINEPDNEKRMNHSKQVVNELIDKCNDFNFSL